MESWEDSGTHNHRLPRLALPGPIIIIESIFLNFVQEFYFSENLNNFY